MKIRTVNLHQGPFDGAQSIASHDTAIHSGEVYVWDGSEDENSFVHALTAIGLLSVEQRCEERQSVKDWMDNPTAPLRMEIPSWRVNAWLQILRLE